MTRGGDRDAAPARTGLRSKRLLRLAVFATAACATVLPQAGQRAIAQSRLTLVRVHDRGPALYRPFTSTCADALRSSLSGQGIQAQVDDLRDASQIKALPRGAGTLDVDVRPAGLEAFPIVDKPDFGSLVESYSPFRDWTHFEAFLDSRLYEAGLRRHLESVFLHDSSLRTALEPNLWLGWAYLGTTQLFSADAPIVRPSDLSGRTLFSEFSSVSLLGLHSDLGFGYNADLAHAPTTVEGQRAVLSRALGQTNRSGILIAQPLVLGDSIIPDAYKRYVALPNWHIMMIAFELRQAWLHESQIEELQRIIRDASLDCSKRNFEMEVAALGKLKREGSTVTPVDAPAFHALTLRLLKHRLDEAVRKEKIAKQALDRKTAELNATEKSSGNRPERKRTAQPPERAEATKPEDDVAILLAKMKGLFNFDAPVAKEKEDHDDAVRDVEQAQQMIDFYNQIQELR